VLVLLSLAACTAGPGTGAAPSAVLSPTRAAPTVPAPVTTPVPVPVSPSSTGAVPPSGPTVPPAAGRCHYRPVGTDPLTVLPDPVCTPGAANPQVTQATLASTVCKGGWTSTVRPPVSVTQAIKARSLTDYGLPQSAEKTTELDHLLPLEVGGAPADAANLWVQPNYAHPHPSAFDHNPKDPIEFAVRNAVCSGRVTLAAAQAALLTDWTTAPVVLGLPSSPSTPGATP